MIANASKSSYGLTVPKAPRVVRKCAAALGGVPWGAPVEVVVLLVAVAPRPRGLTRRVMVRPSTAPLYADSFPRSYTPQKNAFPLWDALQFAPRALYFHRPSFLPPEEAYFRMGPPHQGTARARKHFTLRHVSGTNWCQDGGQGFSRLGLPCPLPFVYCQVLRLTLIPHSGAQKTAKSPVQGDIRHVAQVTRWASVEYPPSNAGCTRATVELELRTWDANCCSRGRVRSCS